ncbi:hypothetical protein NQ176_g3935 [Zarea fungicola]|uniref:Uncharacterized protein n=1 Tax=Zarea fungicola TaxID=93591 RepID=A0ACC1NH36_9HYPO|nr:hypothetical protein NQ176_g3935 [Lecanicillium fungicola]
MLATKLLLIALATYATGTPVASAPGPSTTNWVALEIPHSSIDWNGIDVAAYNNPANYKEGYTANFIGKNTSPNVARSDIDIRSGPCSQGTCPDYDAAFDLMYSFVAVPQPPACPGCPPTTIFSSDSYIRVNDCNNCQMHKVGSSLGGAVPGGCYDFNGCGRDQTICVDPGNYRAHRIWKDRNVKTCYHMKVEDLGGCGFVKSRIILHPDNEVACTW